MPAKVAEEVRKEPAPVRALLAELDGISGGFRPAGVTPLKSLDLGVRAVVGDPVPARGFRFRKDARLPGRPEMRPRALLSVSPPAYSADGRVAVAAGSAPWSIHSADLLFAFRREGDGWGRVFVRARYYF